jgi:hypothetical protein
MAVVIHTIHINTLFFLRKRECNKILYLYNTQKLYPAALQEKTFSGKRNFIMLCLILCLVDPASLYNLINKANLVHNFFLVCLFFFLHVSGDYVPIIRRNNYICATLGTSYSVWMTVWYAGWTLHTRQSSIQNNKYRVSHKYSSFS